MLNSRDRNKKQWLFLPKQYCFKGRSFCLICVATQQPSYQCILRTIDGKWHLESVKLAYKWQLHFVQKGTTAKVAVRSKFAKLIVPAKEIRILGCIFLCEGR